MLLCNLESGQRLFDSTRVRSGRDEGTSDPKLHVCASVWFVGVEQLPQWSRSLATTMDACATSKEHHRSSVLDSGVANLQAEHGAGPLRDKASSHGGARDGPILVGRPP